MRPLVLIRPEPGLSASAERARALGLTVIERPLYRIEPVQWAVPTMASFDAIVFTSANAVREAGSCLGQLFGLPAYAVGEATAEEATKAGFRIAGVGRSGVDALLGEIPPHMRLLHLTGENRIDPIIERTVQQVIVYRSVEIEANMADLPAASVIAVHSPRAGARLAALIEDRKTMAVAAVSAATAAACGLGWSQIVVAPSPTDKALLSLAATLCQTGAP